MVKMTRIWVWLVIVGVAASAGCGGDDGDDDRVQKAIEGTFVGKVRGTGASLAVVAAPATRGQRRRDVTVYVSDGERMSRSFAGTAEGNSFTASAEDGEGRATGKLKAASATGTIELPGGKTARYEATHATAASGLYDLTVSRRGKLTGASAAGVGLSSEAGLRAPGTGTLRFADGRRRKLDIATTGDPTPLRSGQIRMIVLPDGQMSGAGQIGSAASGGEPEVFIRSDADREPSDDPPAGP
jgi:hypothetical protein